MSKQGWLVKQGGSWKSWKHRWFVIDGHILIYYKDQLKIKKMGEIDLSLAFSITPNDNVKVKHFSNIFSIRTPSRVYNISASTPREREEWVEELLNSKNGIQKSIIPQNTEKTNI